MNSEFRVTTTTTGNQHFATVGFDASGGFVISWVDDTADAGGQGIFAQRFAADGSKLGSEFMVNTTSASDQKYGRVAVHDDGSFVITWSSNLQDGSFWGVFAQRVDAGGNKLGGEIQANTFTTGVQKYSTIGMDGDGNFIIAWESEFQDPDSSTGVYARRFDANGVALGSEFRLNTAIANNQWGPNISVADSGEFVTVWESEFQDGSGWGIYAQQYDRDGNQVGSEFQVNTTSSGDQANAQVAVNSAGDFVIAWEGNGSGDAAGVFARHYKGASGLTFQDGDGVFDASMTFTGSLADVNAALEGLTYTPNSSFVGVDTLTVTTDDLGNTGSGGAQSDSDGVTINVVTPAPVITLPGGAVNYTENDPPTIIDATATASDPDSVDFDTGTLTIDFTANGTANDRLTIRDQGPGPGNIEVSGNNIFYTTGPTILIGTFTGGTDGSTPLVITLNAGADQAAVQALMRNITYENVADNASTLTRTVRFVLTDGDGGTSNSASEIINFTAENDAPTVDLNGTDGGGINFATTFTEDGGAVNVTDTDAILSDVDDTACQNLGINLSNISDGANELITIAGYTFTYGTNEVVVRTIGSTDFEFDFDGSGFSISKDMGGNMPLADLQSLIRGITYENTSQNPTTGNRTIDIEVQDVGGLLSPVATSTITVNAENDAPVVTTSGGATSYSEQATATVIDGALTLVDPDGFDGADPSDQFIGVVRITGNYEASDILGFTNTANIEGNVVGDQLTLSVIGGQTATVADFQAALRAVTFYNGSDTPSELDRTITFSFDDGVDGSNLSTKTVQVTALNDAPIANDDSYTTDEDSLLDSDTTWADSAWQYRRLINFDNLTRAENLTDFPVLIKLDSTTIDYSKTQDQGQDLRFYDADGNALAHEIETWDEAGTSYVWVKVPQIDANSNTDFVHMYYENAGAPDAQNAAGVWSDYRAVYHLNEDPGATGTVGDAAGNFDATNVSSTDAAGFIGNAQDFDGTSQYVDLGDDRDWINNSSAATLSIWMNADTISGTGDILGVTRDLVGSGASRISLIRNGDNIQVIARTMDDSSDSVSVVTTTSPLTTGQWHHITGTVDYASDVDNIKIYVDGRLEGTFSHDFTLDAIPNTDSSHATIGSDEDGAVPFFNGRLDEARIDTQLRSPEWVSAQYASMTDTFVTLGYEQSVAGVLGNDVDLDSDILTVTELNGDSAAVGVPTTLPSGALLTLNADGTFVWDPNGMYESLDAGDQAFDTFTYMVDDGNGGTDTATVTITIQGKDDAPVVTGTFVGAVLEGNVGDAPVIATGNMAISDVDDDDNPVFNDVASTAGDNGYGSFSLTAGTWTYTLDQSAVQNLDASDVVNDTITYTATDGSTQQITVTITGTDDASVITGTVTGGVVEGNVGDAPVTATGSIAISDVDDDDSPTFNDVASTAGDNAYGSFTLTAGAWTYTLDQSAVQNLDAGDVINDTITYTATDGSTQQITVTITGTDDASVLSGTVTGAVVEGNVGDAPVTATGSIAISDVDDDDNPTFNDVASTAGDNAYGSFTLTAGTWTYTLDQSAVQNLDASDVVNDTITYTATDGATQQITVTITGTDDASVITGTVTGAVNEGNVGDAPVTATGSIAISDVDDDDNPTFNDVASTAGDNAYGSFTLTAGTWTYTLDQSAVQNLDASDVVIDTITYTATDGATQQITVTITGTDDTSVITGTVTGAVNEGNVGDAPVTATGSIAISDVDDDDNPTFNDVASTVGDNAYGSFTLTAGTWTYTLDQSAVQNLDASDVVNDTINYTATDGATQQITVTITGTDDASVITGTVTGAVNEGNVGDAPVTATGSIAISDIDDDDSPTLNDVASTVGDNAYGSFVLTSGTWTYTLDQSTVQNLDASDVVNDTITYTATDGATQQITVTITGTDDASVITGTVTGAVNEGNVGDAPVTATGSIAISDVDDDDAPTFNDVASTAGDNAYGSFPLVSGTWTYTLDQSAVQNLDASDVVNDTITYTATDGATQQITVTITGTDDASVITGTVTGAVNEGNVGDAPVTATGSIAISDVDDDDSPAFNDVASTVGDNAYGSFTLTAGTWTYTLDQSAVQDLDASDVVNDTITYTATDGSTQQITVTITGTDDASVITGTVTGAVNEGNVGDAPVTATGSIAISDVDDDDNPTFNDVASTAGDNAYGSFTLTAGTWTYTLDQSAVQNLDASDVVNDTITYTATDGATQQITVTITGTDDASVITGTVTGAVNEGNVGDAPVTATGSIAISDIDDDDSPTLNDVASTVGDNAYGSFTLTAGTWTYTLDQSAVQDLDASDVVNDTITYTATDGATQQITVTITGTDDASVITGTVTGAVNEGNVGDAPVTATGSIAISDVDDDDNPTFNDVASTVGDNAYGSFTLTAGTWTYTLDQSAVQNLDASDVVNDTINYTATDGATQQITVTITGTDDASVITGTVTGAVNEGNVGDAPVTATGSIAISDIDDDDTPTFNDVASTAGDNAYGSFALVSGTWTYTLDQSAVQDLDASDVVNDTITYTATDGATQQITVTITGTDDASVITGTVTGAVNEGNVGDAPVTATGSIAISDVDDDDSPAFNDVASTAGDNAYGSFALVSGTWTYTLDQSAVQNLDASDVVNDTITYTATDGATQQITVTITGTDDASVITGAVTGTVNEGNIGDAPVTATGSIAISDVDDDDAPTFNDVASTTGDNAYGSFTLTAGTWTYTLDQSAVQNLDASDVVNDTITYTATDGAIQQITVTITGTDDASVITGTVTGAVNEGNVGDAPVTATGFIAIADVDDDDSPAFNDVASTAGDNAYGSFTLTAGTWTYTLDQSAVQNLDAGDIVNDTITYTVTDGSTQQITVTINGTDDASVITGTVTGAVNEGNVGDAPVIASGSIAISDIDDDDSPTINDAGATASDNAYGSFTLTAGTWTYTLDQSAVQNLDANDVVNDTITYIATDGSTQQITITINGADDPAFIGGSDTGQVTEDLDPDLNTQLETSGSLTVSDLDAGEASFTAATVTGSYGQLSIDAAGNWSYTADNLQAAIQSLADGSTITDTVTITSADGTTHDIVIGILGVDDAPLVSAPAAAGTTNGNPLVFSGAGDNAITVDDVDANDLEVTLTATNGTVELASTNGLTFLVGDGSADTVMRFTGSSAAINAAMNGLSFQPDADFSGNASLRVAAADSGSGTLNTYETVNISVAAIAQTPAATTATQSLDELVFEYISETAIGGPGGANETPGIPGSTTNVESNHTSNPSTQTSLESGTTSSGGVQEINVSAFLSPSGITLSSASDGGAAMLEDGDGDSHETVHKLVKILLKDAVNGVQAILSINMEAAAWDMLSQVLDQMGDGVNSEPESPVFTAASNMTFTLTAGYVSWLLRAGYLSASLLSALPLWREFDPLPILAKKKNKKQRKPEQEAKDPDEMNDIPAEERIFESGN